MAESKGGFNGPRPRYWLRRFVLLMVLLIPAVAWGGWRMLNGGLVEPDPGALPAPRVEPERPVYVLVIGVDERPDKDDPGRSDTLILVRLAPAARAVHVVSIPRDTMARVRGEPERINVAYSIGGPELAARSVADLLRLPVVYYVKVNLQGFVEIIDRLGGIELEVEDDYYYHDPYQDLTISLAKGHQVLDGDKALQYVRLRYDGAANDDISRIGRQQKFMQAVRAKLIASPLRAPALVTVLRRYVTSNIPERDQLQLATKLFEARDSVEVLTLPGEPDDSEGTWAFDREAWKALIETWPR
jgi:polyisoprenyl-teichoic acid--peptidoglycan teichoic acid transferase